VNVYDFDFYFLLVALSATVLASLRVASRKGATSALAGLSGACVAAATGLVVVGEYTPIAFSPDIALYLLVLGPVGTIIIAKMLTGGGFQ
jgi:multisubunit Na+/H+ antiporter MnhF subunit